MNKTIKRERPERQIIPAGKLETNAMYTAQGCKNWFGLGRYSLAEARRSGVVKPIELGGKLYYEGSELIEWIRQSGTRK